VSVWFSSLEIAFLSACCFAPHSISPNSSSACHSLDTNNSSQLASQRDQNSTLATEIRNLRQQLIESKESCEKERSRADRLEKEVEARR